MTTQDPQDPNVPKWFYDFAQENARQHQELGTQIAEIRGELRTIKAVSIGLFVAVAAAAAKYLIGF